MSCLATSGSRATPVERLLERPADEVLLAGDAPEVGRAVVLPLPVDLVLVVPRPHIGERGIAVERHAAGRGHVEPAVTITGRVEERHLHAADHLDQLLEGAEVDVDVVVDLHAEVLLDRLHEAARVGGIEGRVDAATPVAVGDAHPQVTGERQDRGRLDVALDPQDHDRVGAVADDRLAEEGGGVGDVGGDAVAAVRARPGGSSGPARHRPRPATRSSMALPGRTVRRRPCRPASPVGAASSMADHDPLERPEAAVRVPDGGAREPTGEDDQHVDAEHEPLRPGPAQAQT